MKQDEEHLRLLAIFHYVVGGILALFSFGPIFHLALGLSFILAPESWAANGETPPAFFGWFFVIFAALCMVIGWALAACVITAGRYLARRTHYIHCLVLAAIEFMFMPLGTALGIVTIIVLMRESVKEMFGVDQGAQPAS